VHKGYIAFKLRQHGWSAAYVTLGVIAFAMVMLLAYSAFDMAEMIQAAQGGQDIMKAMAGARGMLTWDTAAFIGIVWRHPLVLVLVIGYTISLGGGFAAKEVSEKTADLVFARPITRSRLLLLHLLVASGLLMAMTAALSLAVYLGSNILALQPPSFLRFVQAGAQYFVFTLALLALAYLVGAVTTDAKAVLAILGGILAAMYAVELVGGLWAAFEPLLPLSLFTYLTPRSALLGEPAALTDTLIMLSVALAALTLTHVQMLRRDL